MYIIGRFERARDGNGEHITATFQGKKACSGGPIAIIDKHDHDSTVLPYNNRSLNVHKELTREVGCSENDHEHFNESHDVVQLIVPLHVDVVAGNGCHKDHNEPAARAGVADHGRDAGQDDGDDDERADKDCVDGNVDSARIQIALRLEGQDSQSLRAQDVHDQGKNAGQLSKHREAGSDDEWIVWVEVVQDVLERKKSRMSSDAEHKVTFSYVSDARLGQREGHVEGHSHKDVRPQHEHEPDGGIASLKRGEISCSSRDFAPVTLFFAIRCSLDICCSSRW